jgi:pimeloyl-ACP methyl ester carboxylesterase
VRERPVSGNYCVARVRPLLAALGLFAMSAFDPTRTPALPEKETLEAERADARASFSSRLRWANGRAVIALRVVLVIVWMLVPAAGFPAQPPAEPDQISAIRVRANDGTSLAVECAGAGPSLLIVHGGTGDRRRWEPLFPLLAPHFAVCAMDRRGHGESEAGATYSLQKEFEDVLAVVNALPGSVFVLGHSYGGVCALEAAFLTKKITKLVLYEPPLQDVDHTAVADAMDELIRAGRREEALVMFLQDIVMVSPTAMAAMKATASWQIRVAGVDIQTREIRALSGYRFDPKRIRTLHVPTLLLTGDQTASPQLKRAIRSLMDSLPQRSLYVFEGQEHSAMDNLPGLFSEIVTNFLLGK